MAEGDCTTKTPARADVGAENLRPPWPPIHPRNPLLPRDPPRRVPMHPRRRGQPAARAEVRHNGRADFGGDGGPAGTRGAFLGATAAAHWRTAGMCIRRRISRTTDRDTPDRRAIS